ncbi:MAG: hypothetical protein HRU14_05690, partial [Planctomycetes bacterium]|nr:hypothetical protein [Planctomycetota bacterium]
MIRHPIMLLLLVSVLPAQESGTPPPGFVSLLQGDGLAGWRGRPHLDPKKEAAMAPR